MTRARGTGHVYQNTYKDRQGRTRTASTWALQYYDRRAKRYRRKGGFKTEAAAEQALAVALEGTAGFSQRFRVAIGEPIELSAVHVATIVGPLVYVWRREGAVLYVGMSVKGLRRPLDPSHKTVHLEGGDSLQLWPCKTAADAVSLERRLIAELLPALNVHRYTA